MCLVEKPEVENSATHSHSPRKSLSKKSSAGQSKSSKVKKRQIQPSLICGVSLRRSKLPLNCNEEGQDGDLQTEVQIMNKVNEVVSSGDTSPHIITNSDGANDQISSDDDILGSTSFMPYILVVSVFEDTNKASVSKETSSESLAPTLSSGNIVPTLGSITMNQQDWNLLDHMYDSDPDVQIVKVTPGPASLSTSSPTEGGTKQEELGSHQEGVGGQTNQGGQKTSSLTSVPESAIKRLASQRAGSVIQCLELPPEVQSDHLRVTSICPTLDRQHLVVVLSPKSQSLAQSQFKSSVLSSNSMTNSKCASSSAEECTSESANDSASNSNSDAALLVTYSASGLELGFKTNSNSSQSTENTGTGTDNSGDDANTNSSSVTKSDPGSVTAAAAASNSNGYILVYKFSYDCDNYYASIEEKPVVIRAVTESEMGVEKILVLPREVSEQVEEDEILTCDDELLVPTSSLMSVVSGKPSVLYGQMSVIFGNGKMGVLNSSDLAVLAMVDPPGRDKFVDVTYCSGRQKYIN